MGKRVYNYFLRISWDGIRFYLHHDLKYSHIINIYLGWKEKTQQREKILRIKERKNIIYGMSFQKNQKT